MDPLDGDLGYGFQPHRLPDAAGPVVPDDVRMLAPVLFAARLRHVERIVLDTDDEVVVAGGVQCFGDIEGERRVTAFVRADPVTVDPDDGPIVHGAESEHQPAAGAVTGGDQIRGRQHAVIPERLMEARVVNLGGGGFGRERDEDRTAQMRLLVPAVTDATIVIVERRTPTDRSDRSTSTARAEVADSGHRSRLRRGVGCGLEEACGPVCPICAAL